MSFIEGDLATSKQAITIQLHTASANIRTLTITDDLDWGQHISEITCNATKSLGFHWLNLALAPRHT